MNKKVLMIANTTYQIIVCTWIKMTVLKNDDVDIIVSNHMNSGGELAKNLKRVNLFSNVFFVETKGIQLSRTERWIDCILRPTKVLNKYVRLDKKYDALYIANVDYFAQLLYHTIVNNPSGKVKNKRIKLFLFEDGISSYSKLFEKFYFATKAPAKRRLFFYRPKRIFGNVDGCYLFSPKCLMWSPNTEILQLEKIDVKNEKFKETINVIFDYEQMTDAYDKKYLFMEEPFFSDGADIDDVEVLEQIAQRVGKENVMVKIHPRNPVNRFQQLGYKTNENVAVPWEVIILNQSMENKILLTISSTSVVNPIRLFGQKVKVFSFYSCLKEVPQVLAGDLWETAENMFRSYYPCIEVPKTSEEFFERFDEIVESLGDNDWRK